MSNYRESAIEDANEMVRSYAEEIVEKLLNDGEASDDFGNDYAGGDSYHHENHIDVFYTLLEAAELLNELSNFEETDSGMWEGQEPKDAVCSMAAYTYGNAVASYWQDVIESINDDESIVSLIDEYNECEETCTEELETHRADAEASDDFNDEDENFNEEAYTPPFELDAEVEKRQLALRQKLGTRINEICAKQ